jgi:HK97 family phage portal protein
MAVYGEVFWYVAKRDATDGSALSILPVSPLEVQVEEDPRDLRYPVFRWRGRRMANEDFRQVVTHKRIGALRGEGPLQLCGAAVSVSVEAQDWAANYYAGGTSETLIKSAVPVSDVEAEKIKARWADTPNNLPHVIGPTIDDVKDLGVNVAGAQMLEARSFQVIEAATAFGMPAKMLNAAVSGSDITYQNVGEEFDSLLRQCLLPDYLEPAEQALSDLLTRSTIARFNTDAYLRPDVRTRAEVYKTLVDAGRPDIAGSVAGFAEFDLENSPVAPAPPAAVPSSLPFEQRSRSSDDVRAAEKRREVRCEAGHLVGKVVGTGHELYCRHCKRTVQA